MVVGVIVVFIWFLLYLFCFCYFCKFSSFCMVLRIKPLTLITFHGCPAAEACSQPNSEIVLYSSYDLPLLETQWNFSWKDRWDKNPSIQYQVAMVGRWELKFHSLIFSSVATALKNNKSSCGHWNYEGPQHRLFPYSIRLHIADKTGEVTTENTQSCFLHHTFLNWQRDPTLVRPAEKVGP